jgi:hypothetical protein
LDSESTDLLAFLYILLADATRAHGLGAGPGAGCGAVVSNVVSLGIDPYNNLILLDTGANTGANTGAIHGANTGAIHGANTGAIHGADRRNTKNYIQ